MNMKYEKSPATCLTARIRYWVDVIQRGAFDLDFHPLLTPSILPALCVLNSWSTVLFQKGASPDIILTFTFYFKKKKSQLLKSVSRDWKLLVIIRGGQSSLERFRRMMKQDLLCAESLRKNYKRSLVSKKLRIGRADGYRFSR